MEPNKSAPNQPAGWLVRISRRAESWLAHPLGMPALLLVIAMASYGLLINRLGYYWDDFPLNYIRNIYGNQGLVHYFSTNRPFWGLLYQLTFSFFSHPWQWQVFALLGRWLSAVLCWLVVREIWPGQRTLAIWASLLFLVYPGFMQQHISVIYGNMFSVLDCFLLSLVLMLKAIPHEADASSARIKWGWMVPALLLSAYNLLALEYFYALDLLRPVLILIFISQLDQPKIRKMRLTILYWLPYLALWIAITIWRVFFFGFQTHNYQMLFFKNLKSDPLQALMGLFKDIATSFYVVMGKAWAELFKLPQVSVAGLRTTVVMLAIILLVMVFTAVFVRLSSSGEQKNRKWIASVFVAGLAACLLGGVPWWLTSLPPTLTFPSDRFTLPFMLGVSLIFCALIGLLPNRGWWGAVMVGVLVGFAAGRQFQVANQYRRDWETQRRFFWQLAWRIPELEPGTTLMVNDLPVTYYSDNSLTAPLNWFWAPTNTSTSMAYLLFYPSQRLGGSLTSLQPNTAISVDYLAATFSGNTSQVVGIYYDPPACVRVLDRALDSDNRMLSMDMQAAAALSSNQWINPQGPSAKEILPAELYAPELAHAWCYYFEMADRARQEGDWEKVASLGDQAFALHDYPNDPAERFPFIEGYAHVGNWPRAMELSRESQQVTTTMEPLLCRLWQRISASTPESADKSQAVTSMSTQLNCTP